MQNSPLLESVALYLQNEVAPYANQIDTHPDALRSAFQGLCDRNLLALRVPQDWGGVGVDPLTFYQFQEQIARFSGALAFLQTQHQSAGTLLAKSENESLKQAYLPHMGNGKKRVGIGFSHLRRENNPPLKVMPVEGGYRLHGTIPWLTGFGFFQDVLVAGLLPDGQAVYGIMPFTEQPGQLHFSPPMPLAAMTATNTVSAEVIDWFLPQEQVASVQPAKAIHHRDRTHVLNHSFFALGCAQAGLDVVETVRQTKPFLAIAAAHDALNAELCACRRAIHAASDQPFEEKLRLRSAAIELSVRCAHAAVIVSSGAANSQLHPAQRIYREALVFSVAGQTTDVLEATLRRIAGM